MASVIDATCQRCRLAVSGPKQHCVFCGVVTTNVRLDLMEKARTAAERAERRNEAQVGIVPTQLQDVGAIVRVGERLAGCVPMGRRYSSAEINDWIGGHRPVLASTRYRGSEGTPRPVAAD